ncbi:hypothetical protein CPB86DRAFT_106343 [Serendipita vermifera]|nr:hypothetical protein CPB86DRAFT_106343 [Serendipita vermifera]
MYQTYFREIHGDERPAFLLVSTVPLHASTVMRSKTRILKDLFTPCISLVTSSACGIASGFSYFQLGRCLILNSGRYRERRDDRQVNAVAFALYIDTSGFHVDSTIQVQVASRWDFGMHEA